MTGRELIELLGQRPALLLAAFALPPVATVVTGLLHGRGQGGQSPYRHVYGVLVYLACGPGMLAGLLTVYTAVFTRESLLDQNLLVYVAPIVAMVATLVLMARNVDFDAVPGFDRLSGLMLLLAVTFVILFALSRTRLLLIFGGSILYLAGAALVLFLLLKVGADAAVGRKRRPTSNC